MQWLKWEQGGAEPPHFNHCFRRLISPTLPVGAQVDNLESRDCISDHISSDTGVSLSDTFSLEQDRSQWMAVATRI